MVSISSRSSHSTTRLPSLVVRVGAGLCVASAALTVPALSLTLGDNLGISLAVSSAEKPLRLPSPVTDMAGVLGNTASLEKAIAKVQQQEGVQLWVVFVPSFDGLAGASWATKTRQLSDLGTGDALLAVAVKDRAYRFDVQGMSTTKVNKIASSFIEPQLSASDWRGSVTAALDGLSSSQSSTGISGTTLGVAALGTAGAAAGAVALSRRAKKKRLARQFEDSLSLDPSDPRGLLKLPTEVLDKRAEQAIVDASQSIEASTSELQLAASELGSVKTGQFDRSIEQARQQLDQAITAHRQVHDSVPESTEVRRELLVSAITACAGAEDTLESQREEFERLRNLVIEAPRVIDKLTQLSITVRAQIPSAHRTLAQLDSEYDATTLSYVAENATIAQAHVDAADKTLDRGRDVLARPVGQQGEITDVIHSAESSLSQAQQLLEAVDQARTNISLAESDLERLTDEVAHEVHTITSYIAENSGLDSSLRHGLEAARTAGISALDHAAEDATSVLARYSGLVDADVTLDQALAEITAAQDSARRKQATLDSALQAANSAVSSAASFIATRSTLVGAQARSLAVDAQSRLDMASSPTIEIESRIDAAVTARTRAEAALSAAQTDVNRAHMQDMNPRGFGSRRYGRGSSLGGVVLGALVEGAVRGSMSNWGAGRHHGGFGGGSFGGGGGSSWGSGGGRF